MCASLPSPQPDRSGKVAARTAPPRTAKGDPRTRILQVSERLFAQRGLACTNVRDLAREAEVNVAAINYYFGGKEDLYLETLRYSFRHVRQLTPRLETLARRAARQGTAAAARAGIRSYISEFIRLLVFSGEMERHTQLLSRELNDPSPSLAVVIQEFVEPHQRILRNLLIQARPGLSGVELQLHVNSIVGQCLLYGQWQPLALHALGRHTMTRDLARKIASHIASYALAALDQPAQPSRPKR